MTWVEEGSVVLQWWCYFFRDCSSVFLMCCSCHQRLAACCISGLEALAGATGHGCDRYTKWFWLIVSELFITKTLHTNDHPFHNLHYWLASPLGRYKRSVRFFLDKIFDRDKSVHVHQITKGQKSTNDRVEPVDLFDIANFYITVMFIINIVFALVLVIALTTRNHPGLEWS